MDQELSVELNKQIRQRKRVIDPLCSSKLELKLAKAKLIQLKALGANHQLYRDIFYLKSKIAFLALQQEIDRLET